MVQSEKSNRLLVLIFTFAIMFSSKWPQLDEIDLKARIGAVDGFAIGHHYIHMGPIKNESI
jgi:hypothetical protein